MLAEQRHLTGWAKNGLIDAIARGCNLLRACCGFDLLKQTASRRLPTCQGLLKALDSA